MSHDVYVRTRVLFRSLALSGLMLVAACPGGDVSRQPDAAQLDPPETRPVTVGAFADCTPAGFSDVVCDKGLHCAVVRVGELPLAGYVTKCVPNAKTPVALGAACQFDQPGPAASSLQYDNCDVGLGCIEGICRKLCARGQRGDCGEELCVLPSQVTGTAYCAPSDGCQAVFPQTGCGRDPQGNARNCYVLSDDKGGGTFCLKQDAYGSSTGALDSLCDHSSNCQAGFGCVNPGLGDTVCRPYCALPETPDGGTAPKVKCADGLGSCNPIANISTYGRCY